MAEIESRALELVRWVADHATTPVRDGGGWRPVKEGDTQAGRPSSPRSQFVARPAGEWASASSLGRWTPGPFAVASSSVGQLVASRTSVPGED